MTIADWIKTQKVTQAELAAQLGCSQSTVSRLCAGGYPSRRQMAAIMKLTGGEVGPADFLDLDQHRGAA